MAAVNTFLIPDEAMAFASGPLLVKVASFCDLGLPPPVTDLASPYVTLFTPGAGDTGVDGNTDIFFRILDAGTAGEDGTGVDLSSLQVEVDVNGTPVNAIVNGVFSGGWLGTIVAVSTGWAVTMESPTPFAESSTITVSIDAQDFAVPTPNVMTTFVSTFYTLFPQVVCRLEECHIASLLGTIIQLDAGRSYSPDGSPITLSWQFIQVPSGSVFESDLFVVNPASLKDLRPNTYTAVSFIPDKLGDYLVQLTVSNGGTSDICTALVEIGMSRALCGAGKVPDAHFVWSYISNFWGMVEDREVFETIWSGQLQLIGAELIKVWSNDFNKSLSTIQQTVQRRWQKVDLRTELEDQVQRVIVGNTKEGATGITGEVGAPGAGKTTVLHTLRVNEDFTTIDINYGAKGRIIDVNSEGATIERVSNVTVGGTDYSVAVMDGEDLTDGQSGIPYRIPHLVHIPLLDLEDEGVRAGDTLVLQWTRGDTGLTADMAVRVVVVDDNRIGFEFTLDELNPGDPTLNYDLFEQVVQDLKLVSPSASDLEIAAAANALIAFVPPGINLSTRPFSVHRITVKAGYVIHNTARKVNDLYVSIPYLQEQLKEDPDVILRENFDYSLEGGYVVFASGLFSADSPAPDVLWAECAHVGNTPAIEDNFGRLAELEPDDLVEKATRAPYLAAVKGLWFALTNGPTVANVRLGLQVLMGLPFAEERGKIIDITNNFSFDSFGKPIGRILAEDVDDQDRGVGIRRFYFFPEDVGLETNPLTGDLYKVGDIIPAFAILSKGVEVTDYVKDPLWWIRTLAGNEVKKFFIFKAQIDTESGVFDENDLVFSLDFIRKIKPVYTEVVAAVLRSLRDDIDVQDDLVDSAVRQHFYDNVGAFGGHESTVRSNDYNHQGIALWRGDSRPFMTRSAHLLRDVVTVQNGADVEATSVVGFGTIRARTVGDAAHPSIEGDILAIHPGQPGAGPASYHLYEMLSTAGANGPAVLGEAPTAEPTTFVLNKPDSSLFNYGTGIVASVVRRCVNPIVQGTNMSTTAGAIQFADSIGALFISNGVKIDDHLIIESGANAGEYRIVSSVAQTVPRDYTTFGVPQILETRVGLVNFDGTNPALTNLGSQDFRIISPAMLRTRVPNAQVIQSGGNMFAEVLEPSTSFPFDVFTPGMVGEELVVQDAQNPLNNGTYTIQAYSLPGRVQITVGSPQTSDASPDAVLTIRSPYHPGFEKAEELAPTEVFTAVVT